MQIKIDEKTRIRALSDEKAAEEWGMVKHGDKFISSEIDADGRFASVKYTDENGNESVERYNCSNIKDNYIIWLGVYRADDGHIMSEEELSESMKDKPLSEINEKLESDRRCDGDILKSKVSDRRERMLTVQKLIDYLKTQNPNACIMGYEPNSLGYIEQWPELPNENICTVGEAKSRQRDFYLNQWFKNDSDKFRKCEDEIAETYRYCKDDDIIIQL